MEPYISCFDNRLHLKGRERLKNYANVLHILFILLTIIPRARVGYEMVNSQRGA